MNEEFEQLQRAFNVKFTEEFAKVLLEAIKSGDFQQHLSQPDLVSFSNGKINIEKRFAVTYIPYREASSLKLKIEQLEKQNNEMLDLLKKFHKYERSTTLKSNIYTLVDYFLNELKEQEK